MAPAVNIAMATKIKAELAAVQEQLETVLLATDTILATAVPVVPKQQAELALTAMALLQVPSVKAEAHGVDVAVIPVAAAAAVGMAVVAVPTTAAVAAALVM